MVAPQRLSPIKWKFNNGWISPPNPVFFVSYPPRDHFISVYSKDQTPWTSSNCYRWPTISFTLVICPSPTLQDSVAKVLVRMVIRYIFKKIVKVFQVTFNFQHQCALWLSKLLSAVRVPRAWRGGGWGGGGGVEEGGLVQVLVCGSSPHMSSSVIQVLVLFFDSNTFAWRLQVFLNWRISSIFRVIMFHGSQASVQPRVDTNHHPPSNQHLVAASILLQAWYIRKLF